MTLIYLTVGGALVSGQGSQVPSESRIPSGRVAEDVGADLDEGHAQFLGRVGHGQNPGDLSAPFP